MAAASNSHQQSCVFVGNIPYDVTEEQLVEICEEVGPVVSFRLVIDKETGKPKGYGFCEYKDEETALSARRNLQGYEINGRKLRVDFADKAAADRNRQQGHGGAIGLTPSVADPQKPIGGPGFFGDSALLHQPIGISLAATAASVMAGAVGTAQNGAISQQNGLCSDQLTHYLAKMSRNQMFEIMSEMKVMATQNKELARQLLLSCPQLPKALFQGQIMLGMVTPQVLQMPNIRQSPGSLMGPGVPESVKESAEVTDDARNSTYPNTSSGLLGQKRRIGDASDTMNPPSKLARLEDRRVVNSTVNQQTSTTDGSVCSFQVVGPGTSPANRISNTEGMQYPEKQAPQQAPYDESSLLGQVMNLTPEQLSSLTLEQRQQVIQLQNMFINR
ncbi:hypothetical protein MKX01_017538 [Papaver californicum]|nr:hypothetical protein MKX01_017538 [Papaver californicum]